MSRYGGGRRSANDLAYGDDYYSGGGGGGGGAQRWDRDRFERMRARSRGPPRERDSFRFEEDDYYDRRGGERRDIKIDIDEDRRRGGGRDYYDHYKFDDEKYEAPRRTKPDYLDEDRYRTSGREVAPYRAPEPRYERYERNAYDYDAPKRPQRPQYIRRQTSLDFDDRRHRPRYDEEDERDVNVNVNFRGPEPPRAPIPPRAPEPVHYDDFDDDYRDVRIRRERERDVYRRRRSSDSFEEIEVPEKKKKKAKRAKATFPKRKAHLRAILEIGQPYEEDAYFYYVHYSSGVDKIEIDEVLRKSEIYMAQEEESSKSYKIDETRMLEPPKPETYYAPPQDEGGEVIETTTTRIIENPSEDEIAKYERAAAAEKASTRKSRRASSSDSNITRRTAQYSVKSPSPSRKSRRGRDKSSRRSEVIETGTTRGGDSGTLILPSRDKSRSRNEIEDDIRRLELEKRSIREGRRIRDDSPREEEYEIVEPDRDIRVERNDRTGSLQFERDAPKRSKSSRRRRRPTQGDVNAALFTLT